MKILLTTLTVLLLAGMTQAQEITGERAFIVHDYRYEAGEAGGDPDTGQALCGTRCNALSIDYRNVIDPGGWRFIRVASDREVVLSVGNPFLSGHCVCTADEYVVTINDFNQKHRPETISQATDTAPEPALGTNNHGGTK